MQKKTEQTLKAHHKHNDLRRTNNISWNSKSAQRKYFIINIILLN